MAAAARAGLDVVGLTDHDTTTGWSQAAAAVPATGVTLLRGTEISCAADGVTLHLLAYLFDPEDAALRDAYQEALTARGFGPILTGISPAPDPEAAARFWYAEDYHQQYLFKNPGGYECHARTGLACPAL